MAIKDVSLKDIDFSKFKEVEEPKGKKAKDVSLKDIDFSVFKKVEEQSNTIYFEDEQMAGGFPESYRPQEMEYGLNTDINGRNKADFFGKIPYYSKQFGKGMVNFTLNIPKVPFVFQKEVGELIREVEKPKGFEKFTTFGLIKRSMFELGKTKIDDSIIESNQRMIDFNNETIDKIGIKRPEDKLGRFIFDLGGAAGSLALSIGTVAVTGNPILASGVFGALQQTSLYEEARAKGKTAKEAFRIGSVGGIAETSLEYVGLHVFLESMKVYKPFGRLILRTATESIQEISQQFSEETVAKISGIRDTTWKVIVANSLYAGGIGAITGAGASTVVGFVENNPIKELMKYSFSVEASMQIVEYIANSRENEIVKQSTDIIDGQSSPMTVDEKNIKESFTVIESFLDKTDELREIADARPEDVLRDEVIDKIKSERIKQEIIEKPEVTQQRVGIERDFAFDDTSTKKEGHFRLKPPPSAIDYFDRKAFQVKDKKSDFISKNKVNGVVLPEGIRAIVGKVAGTEVVQDLRFDKNLWSEEKAKEWFEANKGEHFVRFYYIPKIEIKKEPEFDDPTFQENFNLQQKRIGFINKAIDQVKSIGVDTKEIAGKSFSIVSTRLSNISSKLKHVLRRFHYNINTSNKKDIDLVKPFLEKVRKINREDYYNLDFALKNRYVNRGNEIIKKHGLEKEFKNVRIMLDDMFKRAESSGLDINFLEDYFPRKVIDYEGLINYLRGTENWTEIERHLKREDPKNELDNEDKAEIINKLLRGYGGNKIGLFKPGFTKKRAIDEVTPDINTYYQDSMDSLMDYIAGMNNAIEARKFFGIDPKHIDESIGAYVNQLIEDNVITTKEEKEIKTILMARFKQGTMHGAVRAYKNITYIYTMGSPISSLTQLGDLAFSIYKNGGYRTAKGFIKTVLAQERIKKEDIGVFEIAQEFSDRSLSGKLVSKTFDIIGLSFIDKLGKESFINSSYERLLSEAKKNTKEFNDSLVEVFGDEAKQVKKDLLNKNISGNVKYLLFSELSDFQPISLAEVPEYYLRSGNLKILYMLKTFTLKLFDVYRNEAFSIMGTDPKRGIRNLLKLTFSLALMGATADTLKDLLLGRDIRLKDLVMDNIIKLMGFTKWQIYKSRRDGLGTAIMQSITPPVAFFDDLYRDVLKKNSVIPDWRFWGRIPVVGKVYYWWFGGGKRFTKRGKRKRGL